MNTRGHETQPHQSPKISRRMLLGLGASIAGGAAAAGLLAVLGRGTGEKGAPDPMASAGEGNIDVGDKSLGKGEIKALPCPCGQEHASDEHSLTPEQRFELRTNELRDWLSVLPVRSEKTRESFNLELTAILARNKEGENIRLNKETIGSVLDLAKKLAEIGSAQNLSGQDRIGFALAITSARRAALEISGPDSIGNQTIEAFFDKPPFTAFPELKTIKASENQNQ